jgi:predicted RecB family nuclease
MKIVNGELQLSASDVAGHLACRYLTELNLQVAKGLLSQPEYRDPALIILQERGQEFEKGYLDGLREQGLTIAEPLSGETGTILSRTIDAMLSGADIIYQGSFKSGEWFGRTDFLVRTDKPSKLGSFSYEVLDTKLARDTRAATMVQLCLYSQLLADVQELMPERMYVMTPADDFVMQVYRCDDFMAYFRLIRQRLSDAVSGKNAENTYPEPVAHCDICSWWQHCDKRRHDDDHLSLVAGLSTLAAAEIRRWEVDTLAEFAVLPLPLPYKPSRGAMDTYVRLHEQARVQLVSRRMQAPYYENLEIANEKGLSRLPEPDAADVFFDLEHDSFAGESGLEYLFGWVVGERYQSRWSVDAIQEKQTFEAFIDEVMRQWKDHPHMHIYHYTAYETSALKRLMGKYGTRENEMDMLLRAGMFVDLYGVTRQGLRAGVEHYSLKDLEVFYGFQRAIPLRQASLALRSAERILERSDQQALPEELKTVIASYNQDDCLSALALRNWLEELRAKQVASGLIIERPVVKTGEASDALTEHDQMIKALAGQLMDGLPVEAADRSPSQQALWLLAHMLDWYRRENNSKWWEFFRLKEMPEDELLEEKSAIAYLVPVPGSRSEYKRSVIDQYRFPAQECELYNENKLKSSDGKDFGSIVSIDKENGLVSILKGPSIKDIHPSAVFAHEMFRDKEKQQSIIRLARFVLENGMESPLPDHRAARDLLMRLPPRVRAGVDWSAGAQAAALAGVHLLNNGVLPIQGPPGAGKSHTASKMIIDAVKTGKRVGITAMSHKVIRNLLDKVLKEATEAGLGLRCAHKLTKQGDTPHPNILETDDNDEAVNAIRNRNVQVLGGTPWLWANEKMLGGVDILFVDEAGQLSLIDTLAAAQGAASLVLLGDPQQLKQPQQGSHPEGTEVSSLEHLLQEHKTIPAERGIFLAETWRMHPAICRFISELFYESRLHSRPGLERQILSGHPVIKGAGLWYLPVIHDGNQSSSKEEADKIIALTKELLAGDVFWTNDKGVKSVLTAADIKVIAPYNAQVQELNAALPVGVHAGTVDKFQGQEAPVIFYSLATSAPENAPRGMEFLYSLNRLNVAVSRARTACIIVASPRLFEPDCKSPAQMRLANAFCRYLEMASVI